MRTSNIVALGFALILFSLPGAVLAKGNAENGKKIVESRSLGNCAACHVVPGMEFPGDVGPDLAKSMEGYTERDRDTVRQWVWDARQFNPDTIMPPFGPNKLLTKEQVDDVVEYLFSIKKKN
ncbi:MAG: sulfur oxidation c-type cytochrome SoxX [Nitrospiraceae bacterium]|nr:sulfur oxidation c-type cytochrome SoxX [Nitrospiraceae bacterium]